MRANNLDQDTQGTLNTFMDPVSVKSALLSDDVDWLTLPLLLRRMTNVEIVGNVRCGVVLKGIERGTARKLAVKIVVSGSDRASRQAKKALIWEHKGYTMCQHRGIHSVDPELVEEGPFLFLFSDLMDCDLYELQDLVGTLGFESALHVNRRLVEAVAYLHDEVRICHMDIKPENIFVRVPENMKAHDVQDPAKCALFDFKLADFGFWATCKDDTGKVRKLKGECGSFGYAAPEICTVGYDGAAADMWSLGKTIFVIMVGFPAWEMSDVEQDPYYATWIDGDMVSYWEAIDTHCTTWTLTPAFKDLMISLMNPNPLFRLTAAEALRHPFFTGEENGEYIPSHDCWKEQEADPDKFRRPPL